MWFTHQLWHASKLVSKTKDFLNFYFSPMHKIEVSKVGYQIITYVTSVDSMKLKIPGNSLEIELEDNNV